MSTPSAAFRAIESDYHRAWLRFHPEEAFDAGVTNHADQLRSYNEDDTGALIALHQKLLSALDELPQHELDDEAALDCRLLRGAASIELHELEAQNWRHRDPTRYLPLQAIYQLLMHPVDEVHTAVKRRLVAIPEYLRGARALLQQAPEHVVPVWLQSAVAQSESGAGFLRDLVRSPLISRLFSNPAKLQTVLDEAAHALDDFARFLQTDIAPKAQGDFACGRVHFDRLLNQRHFLDTDADGVLQLAERLLAQTRAQLREHTRAMQGDEDVQALQAKIRRQHPQSSQLLDSYRQRLRDTRQWLQQADLLTLPQMQSLQLQQTPAFMQPLVPFAAYEPPPASDATQHGVYYITRAEESGLLEHNRFSIDLTCVHEAFPGHHVQFVLANQANRGKLTRLLNTSASMYEGWALYCEQLAIEQGWLEYDEHRFIMLRDRLWRCLRMIIDVKLHSGAMTLQQAQDLLVDELAFDPAQAAAEISWYSQSAATPLCYATGCELLLTAREQLVGQGALSLKAFHDGVLRHGSIALPLGLQHGFGEALWHRVHAQVFQ